MSNNVLMIMGASQKQIEGKQDIMSLLENMLTNVCYRKESSLQGVALLFRKNDPSGYASVSILETTGQFLIENPRPELILTVAYKDGNFEVRKVGEKGELFAREFEKELASLYKASSPTFEAEMQLLLGIGLKQNMRPAPDAEKAIELFKDGDILDSAIRKTVQTMISLGLFSPNIGSPKAITELNGLIWRINEQAYIRAQTELEKILSDPDIKTEAFDFNQLMQRHLNTTRDNAIVQRDGNMVKIFADGGKGAIFANMLRHRLASYKFGHQDSELEPNSGN